MAALVPVLCSRTGGGDLAAGSITASAGGDTFPAGPNSFLYVKNGNAAAVTVTVTPPAAGGPQGTTVAPFALSPVTALTVGVRIYGPFPQNPFGDSNGNINVSYSVTPTVSVTALLMSTS